VTSLSFCPTVEVFVAKHVGMCGRGQIQLRAGQVEPGARRYVVVAECGCGERASAPPRAADLGAWLRAQGRAGQAA
jgi:hypothetical protein